MESTAAVSRVRIACDSCSASADVGVGTGHAYCEACQQAVSLGGGEAARHCPTCGGELTHGSPHFAEIFGQVQHLDAVLAAWLGDAGPLGILLPERPRFHTDLTPVAGRADDPAEVRRLYAAVRHGHFTEARLELDLAVQARPNESRLWASLAIVAERLGELPVAEGAWTRAIALDDEPRARLARGVLRARRGAFDEAAEDLERAGDSHEARWDRAALRVLRAVALTPGLPEAAELEAARREAETPEGAWHEPSVGRLLWSLLVERALLRQRSSASACPDERVLRAAEQELEFDTFWDGALLLHGYALLDMRHEAARVAAPLASDLVRALSEARALHGKAGAPLLVSVQDVASRITEGTPAAARESLQSLMELPVLRMYRFPCAACGEGSIGADAFDEVPGSTAPRGASD